MAKAVTLKNANDEEVYPVTDISLVNGDINGVRIVDASVGSDKLTPNAVWEENIKNSVITPEKLDHDTFPAGVETYWTSSPYTATSDRNLGDVTITLPKAARVMFRIFGALKTSRYTSHILLKVDGTEVTNGGTNLTSFINVEATAIVNLSAGSHTVGYYLGGQDSGTTATLASYYNNGFTWWCV